MTAPQTRSERLKKLWEAGFSSKGFPGLSIILGLLALLAASWLFGAIAEDVTTGDPLTLLDARFSSWLHAHSSEPLTTMMRIITSVHSLWGVAIMTLLVSACWWLRGLRDWVLRLVVGVFGGMLLNLLLKHLFLRPRPDFKNPLLTLTTYSFPSGHTMATTVFYGTLCAFAVSHVRNFHWRALAIGVSLLMIALVGFSRIYLGVHYLSDVLAAIAEGLALLAFSFVVVDSVKRRLSRKRSRK